jgi:hypothetical protein
MDDVQGRKGERRRRTDVCRTPAGLLAAVGKVFLANGLVERGGDSVVYIVRSQRGGGHARERRRNEA